MALDIYITINGKEPIYDSENSIRFDDDENGDFWYLQPLFEKIRTRTSQDIDLYRNCKFTGGRLAELSEILGQEISKLISVPKEEWLIHIGTQTHPIIKELYKPVIKKDLLNKLNKWLYLTQKAIDTNEYLMGIGD